jgi:type IV pilus assembly protein PilC
MPRYLYTAQSLQGERQSGEMEATDIHHLSSQLKEKGFILISAEREGLQKEESGIQLPFGGVSLTEKMFFVRNLRVMTIAGLPLPKALEALTKQTKNEKFKSALLKIREKIARGKTLSSALADYPDIFSEIFQSMVKVGEESGTLDQVLETLNMQMEKEHNLRSKIRGAMIYPAVIICAMIGVGILMLVTVIPTLGETFEELGIELPATTKAIIGLANFMTTKWQFIIVGIAILVILFSQGIKNEEIKKVIDKLMLKIPVFSQIVRNSSSAYMLRTLSSLIKAGTPLPRSLEITSGILGNYYFKNAIAEGAKRVRKGEKLSEVLRGYKNVYPSVVVQMMAVGEETGETSEILGKLADFFEEEVSNTTKNLASIIEPFLMLIIGAAIGFFAVSMIQPMYSMLGAIE